MNLTTLKELLKLLNTYIQTGRQTDSDIKRTIKSIKYIQTDRQADRQTDRQTDDFQYLSKWVAAKLNNCNSKIPQSLSFFEVKI